MKPALTFLACAIAGLLITWAASSALQAYMVTAR